MTDAPENWNDALDKEDVNAFVSDLVTRQIEAAERAAYLRGLADAAAICEADPLDAAGFAAEHIRALAEQVRNETD